MILLFTNYNVKLNKNFYVMSCFLVLEVVNGEASMWIYTSNSFYVNYWDRILLRFTNKML